MSGKRRNRQCGLCGGSGLVAGEECARCGGSGAAAEAVLDLMEALKKSLARAAEPPKESSE
jgi:non-homologous end joining protein Ku